MKQKSSSSLRVARGTSGTAFNLELERAPRATLHDLYHILMRRSWWYLFAVAVTTYTGFIAVFAGLYCLGGDCIEGATGDLWWDSVWFSVQTFSTIGYGALSPKTPYAHLLVFVESFVGLASVALVTAVLFTKFARPQARMTFSRCAVVHERNGVPTLQVRLAHDRIGQLFNCKVTLSVLVDQTTAEGQHMRRFLDLELERSAAPLFALSWTVLHPIDENSPLYGINAQTVDEFFVLMLATFSGTDETTVDAVFAQHRYDPSDLRFDKKFADMVELLGPGKVRVHHDRVHNVEPV